MVICELGERPRSRRVCKRVTDASRRLQEYVKQHTKTQPGGLEQVPVDWGDVILESIRTDDDGRRYRVQTTYPGYHLALSVAYSEAADTVATAVEAKAGTDRQWNALPSCAAVRAGCVHMRLRYYNDHCLVEAHWATPC